MGKLIVIEGLDSSGKQTHTNLLLKSLHERKCRVRKVEFPNYKSPSSSLVKMYLSGDFGENVNDVGPYAASVFYTVDRFATYRMELQDFYEDGGMILADRYTTSNLIHQASKIHDTAERNAYFDWLCDFEYRIFGLPKPDLVFFLDMPPDVSSTFMATRPNKMTGELKKDIHEKDFGYLLSCYEAAGQACAKFGWVRVPCVIGGVVRCIESIQQEILQTVEQLIRE